MKVFDVKGFDVKMRGFFLLLLSDTILAIGNIPNGKDFMVQENSTSSQLLVSAISIIFEDLFKHRNGSVYITTEGVSNRTLPSALEKFEIISLLTKQIHSTKFQIMNYNILNNNKRFFNLFIVENYQSFETIYNAITPEKFHLQGKFLVVFTKYQENAFKNVQRICGDFWNKVIVNVHVLVKSSLGDQAHLYTFFPYTKKTCSEANPILWKIFRNGRFQNRRKIFPRNLVTFKKCPLKVASFNALPFMKISKELDGKVTYGGLDGMLLQTLADKIQFSINLTLIEDSEVQWGEMLTNGSSTGAMKMVCKKHLLK